MTDPMTNFLSALVEAIDADEAAVNAQGKADAHRCYDRREEADQRMRRALGALMGARESVVLARDWRVRMAAAEKARDAARDLGPWREGTAHKAVYRAKDEAGAAESDALVAMRRDVIARMGDGA
jgi:hypothetical protein